MARNLLAISLRPMTEADLGQVAVWLAEPHVARWWPAGEAATAEVESCLRQIRGQENAVTTMLVAEAAGSAIGWCQWYRWDEYPAEAAAVGAGPGEVGIDYAIGAREAIGRGLGTRLVGGLVREVRRHHPGAGILTGPDALNRPSRAVLERNGFRLVDVRPLATEPTDDPMAIYRLASDPAGGQ